MSEIVSLYHNQPMTTSLAIANGVKMDHASVIKLARNHLDRLARFGEVGFEIRLNPQGSPTEFLWMNEQQSTFLVTLMRNTPIVLDFKEALVRAFFEMRDRLQQMAPANPPFLTDNLSHGADLAVAADRTFRGFLRSARAAGLRLPAALRVANQQTLSRTGMDMLTELDIDPDDIPEAAPATEETDDSPLRIALEQWAAGVVPGELYSLVDIIAAALSISPRDRNIRQYTVKAGPILRRLGFTKRKMQHHGRPLNLWFKP